MLTTTVEQIQQAPVRHRHLSGQYDVFEILFSECDSYWILRARGELILCESLVRHGSLLG